MRSTFLALACIALACHGRRVQHKEALKNDNSPPPADTKESQQVTNAPEHATSSLSGSLLAQQPPSAINHMGGMSKIARAPASSMNDVVVAERGPEVATEGNSYKANPYTEVLNRARVKSARSPQSSISVPADGMSLPTDDKDFAEPQVAGVPNPKKLLRSAANITPDDTYHSKGVWGRLIAASVLSVLVAGIGVASRKKIASKADDTDDGATQEATPLLIGAEVKAPAKEPWRPKDDPAPTTPQPVNLPAEIASPPKDALPTAMAAVPAVAEIQTLVPEQRIIVSDPVVTCDAKGDSITEERQDDLFEIAPDPKDCKEAADAVRKWLKMVQKDKRARRHRRLQLLQKMQKIRLQRLKAARLEMKRKMQADFGANNDPGIETRISQDKHEANIAPRTHYKDPRKMLSVLLRLLRSMLRAKKIWRER
jgi:hypothetical protein